MDADTREVIGQLCVGMLIILAIAIFMGAVIVPVFNLWDGRVGAIVTIVGFVVVVIGAVRYLISDGE